MKKIKYSIYRENTLRIASGIILLVLLLAGNASALYDGEAQSFLSLINNYGAQKSQSKDLSIISTS
jgi:hypothetical protein